MKFGVREITDIVFKATGTQQLGSRVYSQYDPVMFFDSAKTSTVESSIATVYAQGGRGNPRLLAWDGDKTVTFTFEDALISSYTMSILSGGDLNEANSTNKFHLTEKTLSSGANTVSVAVPYGVADTTLGLITVAGLDTVSGEIIGYYEVTGAVAAGSNLNITIKSGTASNGYLGAITGSGVSVLVDYYVTQASKTVQISPEKFAGYYYVEANTLFRGADGKDYPAQFTIPRAKVQSNFTFTMASTGDPSTFTFVMDAFPAPTRYSTTGKKVLFTLDIADISSDVI